MQKSPQQTEPLRVVEMTRELGQSSLKAIKWGSVLSFNPLRNKGGRESATKLHGGSATNSTEIEKTFPRLRALPPMPLGESHNPVKVFLTDLCISCRLQFIAKQIRNHEQLYKVSTRKYTLIYHACPSSLSKHPARSKNLWQ